MASEILGLFTTPEQYNMMQQQGAQNRALQFAQLSPFEKANYGIYQGAGQLAGATAGLFGVQDPQLRMISQRQMLSKEIDPSDPESILRAAQKAAQLNDQPFAFSLANAARKMQSELALVQQRKAAAERETKQAIPASIAEATAKGELDLNIARLSKMDPTPEVMTALNTAKTLRAAYDKEASTTTTEMKNAAAIASRKGPVGSDAYNAAYNDALDKLTAKTERVTAYGADRNAIAQGEFGKDFADLTKEEKQKVNAIVDQEKRKIAEAGATKLPGQGKEGAKDIPKFRDQVLQTVDPFRKTITSTDQGLQSINDSLKTGNFISFKAARTQLAKALDSGTLSRKDIEDAGGDPSILGGAIDWASTKITATPSADTQNRMKATLTAINKLARQKGQAELDVQRKIATRSGFDQQDVDLIFDIPEFRSKGKAASAAPRTNETIPANVASRVSSSPAAPVKGQPQTRTLKSGKKVTVEME